MSVNTSQEPSLQAKYDVQRALLAAQGEEINRLRRLALEQVAFLRRYGFLPEAQELEQQISPDAVDLPEDTHGIGDVMRFQAVTDPRRVHVLKGGGL